VCAGSANSEGHDSVGKGDGYMDMKPGSVVSSPSANENYMNMNRTPPPSAPAHPPHGGAHSGERGVHVGVDRSGYVSMAPPVTAAGNGYIDMTPGMRCE